MSVWKWITRRRSRIVGPEDASPEVAGREAPLVPVPAPRHPSRIPGPYASLYAYLERRYADMVVLTFGQIEDLLGFPLPDPARSRREWWTSDVEGEQPRQSDAWKLAGRTAKPNLLAQTVAFERAPGL
jgi:hypothetical protein